MDAITNKNNEDDDKKWPYKMLITGPSGSGKTNALINLIQTQDNEAPIDRSYLYDKNLSERKYQLLLKKRRDAGIKHLNDPSAFIGYSSTMNDVYNDIDNYNLIRTRNILIVFDDMIVDIMTNKKIQAIIEELFVRCKKLNISLIFITKSYFSVPKDVRLNSPHYLIMKIHDGRELQNISKNHSADIHYKAFLKIYRSFTNEPYSFLTIDATLPAYNPMRFRKKFSDSLL